MLEFEDCNSSSHKDETSLNSETPAETSSDLPLETSFDNGLFIEDNNDLENTSKLKKDFEKNSSKFLMNLLTPSPTSKDISPYFKSQSFKKVALALEALNLDSKATS